MNNPGNDRSIIFDFGAAEPSDIATQKDEMLAQALTASKTSASASQRIAVCLFYCALRSGVPASDTRSPE